MRAVNYLSLMLLTLLFAILLLYKIGSADVGNPREPLRVIKVMIIDTGVDALHPIFKNRFIACRYESDCADFQGHGTHVTSLVLNGELDANYKPTTPVCANVQVYMCDYKPRTGYRASYRECLEWARQIRPDFINFSSAGRDFFDYEYETFKYLDDVTTVVVAAGNSGLNLDGEAIFPAIYPRLDQIAPWLKAPPLFNVITVGASTTEGDRWVNSNYASWIAYEPGVDIRSAIPMGYAQMTGSSMATALRTNKLIRGMCDQIQNRR